MRSNIIIGLVICGLGASVAAVLMRSKSVEPTVMESQPAATADAQPAPEDPVKQPVVKPVVAAQTGTNAMDQPEEQTPEEKHEAYVAARSAELMDLAMNDDKDSLNTILSELTNRDPDIRQAAIDAAVQFHSRDAIPRLQEASLQTDDAKERAAIHEAIEFLKLPSLTEVLQEQAQQGTNPAAPPAGDPPPQK